VDGLITECLQPAELGWGSHEVDVPLNAKNNGYSLELFEQGRNVIVKSWSPNYLEFNAYLLTHNESLSIAEYLTLDTPSTPKYRPTVYYAYHPCDQAVDSMHLLCNGSEDQIESKEVMKDDIVSGIDELGIFLISRKYKSLWLGSNLSIGKARKMAKHNSATSPTSHIKHRCRHEVGRAKLRIRGSGIRKSRLGIHLRLRRAVLAANNYPRNWLAPKQQRHSTIS
jgi:homospermidine synthase